MDKYTKANQISWNTKVAAHLASEFYGLDSFKAGRCSLQSIEVQELGDVSGRSLLHLQCHFGQDTLSWARRGAIVTGVDFSPEAIKHAKALATELDIEAKFSLSDIYDLPNNLTGKFDIVFTAYGVLCWLSDLTRWATVISHFLKPGGTFYIVEDHPAGNVFDDEARGNLSVRYNYFDIGPERDESAGTYADEDAALETTVNYQWTHSMSDIVNALIAAGLEIQFLHEFPFAHYKQLPWMVQRPDGWWGLPDADNRIPFLFSLMAIKKGSSNREN